MTLELTTGDILKADAEALVNTVNCVGYMGRGIAAQFKRAFPANFEAYRVACKSEAVVPGKMFITETGALVGPKFLVNFPTKRHWRAKSRLGDIELGLVALVKDVRRLGIRSIAIPPLGCGLGGLDWRDVRPRIEAAFGPLGDVRVVVFEPAGAPDCKSMAKGKRPRMTPGRAVLVALMRRYAAGLMDPYLSLLEVHKLMYFAQEAGLPLKLRFNPAHYGPYAANLRHVLASIEGHFVSGYGDGGDQPDKVLELLPGAVQEAERVLAGEESYKQAFERVAEVVDGFETPSSMELLASVHWLAVKDRIAAPDELLEALHRWTPKKRRFSARQVQVALHTLRRRGWLEGTAEVTSARESL